MASRSAVIPFLEIWSLIQCRHVRALLSFGGLSKPFFKGKTNYFCHAGMPKTGRVAKSREVTYFKDLFFDDFGGNNVYRAQ